MDLLLSVSNLAVRYGDVPALWDISISVPRGAVVSIIGSNGAGKTTLLNAISGLVRTTGGEIRLDRTRIDNLSPERIVRSGVCQVPEGRQIFGNLTVEENLLVGAHTVGAKGAVAEALGEVYQLFPRLQERRSQEGGTLSGGEQQMLAIGRALMSRPRLLMLDEPSLGLSPVLVQNVFQAIDRIRAGGRTVLLVEQNSRMALRHSDVAYLIETGRVALSGPSQELQNDENVQRIYLGQELVAKG